MTIRLDGHESSKEEKRHYRKNLFFQLEGIPIVAIVTALDKAGLIDYISDKQGVRLRHLTEKFNANEGYLAVALRLLSTQGYLIQKIDEQGRNYTPSDHYHILLKMKKSFADIYRVYPELLLASQAYAVDLSEEAVNQLESSFPTLLVGLKNTVQLSGAFGSKLFQQLLGPYIGAFFVGLGMKELNRVHDGQDVPDDRLWRLFASFVRHIDESDDQEIQLSGQAQFLLKRASAYGVTVSYLQTFVWIEELLFGQGDKLWDKPLNVPEIHVDRTMNVWGSGGAHQAYFDQIDLIVKDLFNQDLDKQPQGIADMGCGNGAFLIHLSHVIENETLRGQHLDEYPLLIVGSDFNQAALHSTQKNLEKAGVQGHIMHGDIGDPDVFSKELKDRFGVNLGDMLNVRSFLDHNRLFQPCEYDYSNRKTLGTGAYAFRGELLRNKRIEQNLYEHFLRWKPYVKQFGLLVIELHTIDPEIAFEHAGLTAITAYDATHGFTDQYIVEHDVFLAMAKEAGLRAIEKHQRCYPNADFPTVSINLLKED